MISNLNCLHPIFIKVKPEDDVRTYGYMVPCGRCTLCTKKRRIEWTLRLIMESKQYAKSDIAWVTLTYNNPSLPRYLDVSKPSDMWLSRPTLNPRDCTLFMKRLRRRLNCKVRFYCVGEYGSLYQRPHLHLIIFGLKPEDWHYVKEVWKKGFVVVKSFWKETAGYAAGYVQKKLFGNDVYDGRIAPFMRCSQNPPIGYKYFEENLDTICQQGFIVFDKVKCSIPRTFMKYGYKLGKIYKPDMDELQLIQSCNLADFLEKLDMQSVDFSDYYKNFALLADAEFKRMNVTRNSFDIDFGNEVV